MGRNPFLTQQLKGRTLRFLPVIKFTRPSIDLSKYDCIFNVPKLEDFDIEDIL